MRLLRSSANSAEEAGPWPVHRVTSALRPGEMRDRNRAWSWTPWSLDPVTRAQLAARTGLTKSSVSSIVQELLSGPPAGRAGYPARGRPGPARHRPRPGRRRRGRAGAGDQRRPPGRLRGRPGPAGPGSTGRGRRQPRPRPGGRGRAAGPAGRGRGGRGGRPGPDHLGHLRGRARPGRPAHRRGAARLQPGLEQRPLRQRLAGRVPSAYRGPGRERRQRGRARRAVVREGPPSATTPASPARSASGPASSSAASCSRAPTGTPVSSATPSWSRTAPVAPAAPAAAWSCSPARRLFFDRPASPPPSPPATRRADGPVSALVDRLAAGDRRPWTPWSWPAAASAWPPPRWSSWSTRTRWCWAGSTPPSPPGCGRRSRRRCRPASP